MLPLAGKGRAWVWGTEIPLLCCHDALEGIPVPKFFTCMLPNASHCMFLSRVGYNHAEFKEKGHLCRLLPE